LAASSTILLDSDLEAVESPALIFTSANAITIDGDGAVLLQNASTAHAFTFDPDITFRDGKLVFNEATSGTIDGTLEGTDVQLSKAGVGTTTLGASQAITLDTASSVTVDAGTFEVLGTLSGPGTLTVNGPATLLVSGPVSARDVTAAGTIDVDGTLTATDSLTVAPGGTLNITTGSVDVAGTLTNHGTAVLDNGLLSAGSLIVASDGTLTGPSGIVFGPVTVAGRIAPSTEAGNLAFTDTVDFASNSTYQVDIGPGNTGDSIDVTGAVTIAPGAHLAIVADPAQIATSSTVTVLTSIDGISGQFTPTDYAFFSEDFDYQPGSLTVTLTTTGQDFSAFARTPN